MKKIINIVFYVFVFIFAFFIINLAINHFMASLGERNVDKSNYKFAELENGKIFYKEYGEGNPFILLHGFLGSSKDLEKAARELSKNYKVIVPDIPSFGLSSEYSLEKNSKEKMSEALIEFLNYFDYEDYNLLGHSMGGEVALHITLKDEKVNKLFLVDSQGYEANNFYPDFLKEHPGISSFFIRTFFQNYFFQRFLARTGINNMANFDDSEFLKSYYFNYNIPSMVIHELNVDDDAGILKNRIKNIENKTYIIWGDKDEVVPISNAEKFSEDIDNSEYFIISESGHNPFLENFEETIKIIKEKARD
ncbi:alpha/beta fold hydrolase [Geotoga petraea]|uniref:Pimeloyl-ACP methyl ester carboxylesterase n=1 Tax=Geotoga petraea TaxID=28234 RepID=A0A1G6KMA3_9BACT|nr:alpha/beta hydrolase [Geotoga petraea]SDC31958.1 Pimeloyl-ACP methyl ester carboxylesterase [Geotoga petraea]